MRTHLRRARDGPERHADVRRHRLRWCRRNRKRACHGERAGNAAAGQRATRARFLNRQSRQASRSRCRRRIRSPAKPSTSAVIVSALDADGNTIVGAYAASVKLSDLDPNRRDETLGIVGCGLVDRRDALLRRLVGLPRPRLGRSTGTWEGDRGLRAGPDERRTVRRAVAAHQVRIDADGSVGRLFGPRRQHVDYRRVVGLDRESRRVREVHRHLSSPRQRSRSASRSERTRTCGSRRVKPARSARSRRAERLPSTRCLPPVRRLQPNDTTLGPDGNIWYVYDGQHGRQRREDHAGRQAHVVSAAGELGAAIDHGRARRKSLDQRRRPQRDSGDLDRRVNSSRRITCRRRTPRRGASRWVPDKNIWFAEYGANLIGRMTPSGELKEIPVPSANAGPLYITAGPDGNLWFTETGGGFWNFGGRVGYVTTDMSDDPRVCRNDHHPRSQSRLRRES